MSWKSKAKHTYEERVLKDSLIRLALVFDRTRIPFSDEELRTLAQIYGTEPVSEIASKLEDINNEIGYEEK